MKKTKADKSIRPLGDILLEMEPLIQEAMDSHDLQWGDMLSLIYGYLMVHYPYAEEEYEDDTRPVFWYGHRDKLVKLLEKKRAKK